MGSINRKSSAAIPTRYEIYRARPIPFEPQDVQKRERTGVNKSQIQIYGGCVKTDLIPASIKVKMNAKETFRQILVLI